MTLHRTTKARSATIRKIGWLAVASMLATALLAPAAAANGTVWAEVDGHSGFVAGTPNSNSPEYWESLYADTDCTSVDGDGVSETWEADADYAVVIVKAGGGGSVGDNENTIFEDVAAGETVWADANGSSAYDDGDKVISHIILCVGDPGESQPEESQPEESQPEESQPEESQPEESVGGETDTPSASLPEETVQGETDTPAASDPETDTLTGTAAPSDSWRMVLIALAALMASVLVMTPAKVADRRR